jgi:CHAT domain-containing protein/uncharacterized protein HemY
MRPRLKSISSGWLPLAVSIATLGLGWSALGITPAVLLPAMAQTPTTQNRKAEADRLLNQGVQQYQVSQYREALQSWEQALAIYREIGDLTSQAKSLNNLGNAYNSLSEYGKAIAYFQQALPIYKDAGDLTRQGKTLNNLGNAYFFLSEYSRAITYYQQALSISKNTGDLTGQASALGSLGNAYNFLSEYGKAIAYFQQALPIFKDADDLIGQANTLMNLGIVHDSLSEYSKAITYYQQALPIFKDTGNRTGQVNVLGSLGNAYNSLRNYSKALSYFQQAVSLTIDTGDLNNQASVLMNLGNTYLSLSEYGKAIAHYQQSLLIFKDTGDRNGQANAFGGLGNAYSSLSKHAQAIAYYQKALPVFKDTGDRDGQRKLLNNIGIALAAQKQPELAIVFYKQSVNVAESIRAGLQTLPKEQQKSYADSVADGYRRLADLLLQQNRVMEAQRVLDLLKVQELEDYLRDVRGTSNTATGVPNRPAEKQINAGLEAILNRAIENGKLLTELEKTPPEQRNESQAQRIIQLRKDQEKIADYFQDFLTSESVQEQIKKLKTITGANTFDLEQAQKLQDNLKRLNQDAVVLYPFVLADRIELVLVTPYAPPIRRTVKLDRPQLDATITAFRTALRHPSRDAITPASQLYDWLIKPIAADLKQANAKTILYAPDDKLRYIPLAALYDRTQPNGKHWLIENYRINNITALSLDDLNTPPQPQLKILAAAFSEGRYQFKIGDETFTFGGLPFARKEVESLGQTIPGTAERFNQAFNADLAYTMNDYTVVHLATHASFVVGQPEESFILFGNGDRANLRQIGKWRLPNVDLVVLSACETGVGDNLGTGVEILGLGYQVQKTSARATLASLWQVDDGGTQILMNEFYRQLKSGKTTKAQALQQAQTALIHSQDKGTGNNRATLVPKGQIPQTVSDRLDHPYYWAPFILIGNGL